MSYDKAAVDRLIAAAERVDTFFERRGNGLNPPNEEVFAARELWSALDHLKRTQRAIPAAVQRTA